MEQMMKQMMKMMSGMQESLGRIEQRLDGVEQRLNTVEQRLDTLEQRFDRLEERVEQGFADVNEKLNVIRMQTAHNTEQILRVKELELDMRLLKRAVSNQ